VLSFVAGGGFVTFDSGQLGFRLGSTMDTLALFNPDLRQLDSVVFGQQAEDYSQRPMTAGSDDYIYDRLPTPGLGIPVSGSPEEVEYLRVLAIFDSLRITEIMFNPSGSDEGLEFIELQNVGASAINLGGVRFTKGIAFTFPALVLAPGEFLVLSPDLAKFEGRYGSGINVNGPYSGKLDNAGEKLLLQLPEPYDAGVLRFDFNDWYPETDGDGHSLNLVNPLARRDSWGERGSWTVGAVGGSPGGNLVLDAGADQAIVLPATTSLSAALSEDGAGVPVAGFSLSWVQVSGPGTAGFTQPASLTTGVSFSGPGTYVLAVEAVGNGTFTGDQVTVTVDDIYEAWAGRTGAGLPGDDDELDGLTNLLEYALDLDPAVADLHPLSAFQLGSDIAFDYTRYLRKIDITYQAQSSADLGSWAPAAEVVLPGGTPDTEPRRAALPATAARAFWRLRVEKP
jgi:hypothetical protein